MSVSQENILVYGVNISHDEFIKLRDKQADSFDWDDENRLGNREDQSVGFLPDGMSGEYCLVGRQLYSEDSYSDPGLPVKIDTLSDEEQAQIQAEIQTFLGRDVNELNYFFVSHYW